MFKVNLKTVAENKCCSVWKLKFDAKKFRLEYLYKTDIKLCLNALQIIKLNIPLDGMHERTS